MLELTRWILAIGAAIALFLSSWIVLPAPTMTLLPLGVGAPELSPIFLLGNAILLGLGYIVSTRFTGTASSRLLFNTDGLSAVIMICTALGIGFSSIPLLQLPFTLSHSKQAIQKGQGPPYLENIPPEQQALMRSHPFNPFDIVRGIPTPDITPEPKTLLTPDGHSLTIDIYRPSLHQPSGPNQHPVLVTIYGGGWRSGDPKQKSKFNAYMTAQGYAVVALDYRHAPEYQFPIQINDVTAVLDWMSRAADEHNWDRDRVALVGWSAGGHLALLAGYSPLSGGPGDRSLTIKAIVNYYGPVDLAAGYADPPMPDPLDNRAVLETFLGSSPTQVPETYKTASPVTYIKPGLPATLMVYGDRDHVVKPSFGQQLHEQLQAVGNCSVLLRLPWAEHAFDALFAGMGNQIALYHTERFLAWTFNPT